MDVYLIDFWRSATFIVIDAEILGTVASPRAFPIEPIAASMTWPNVRSCVIVPSSWTWRQQPQPQQNPRHD